MRKLESWGYPTLITEDPMIAAGVVLTQCQRVTGRQTGGQTDRQTDGFTIANTTLSILASYADAL